MSEYFLDLSSLNIKTSEDLKYVTFHEILALEAGSMYPLEGNHLQSFVCLVTLRKKHCLACPRLQEIALEEITWSYTSLVLKSSRKS